MSKLAKVKERKTVKQQINEILDREFEINHIGGESHVKYTDYDLNWFDLMASFHLLLKHKGVTNSPALGLLQPFNEDNFTLFHVATLLRGIVHGEPGCHQDLVRTYINNSKYKDEILQNIKVPRYTGAYNKSLETSDYYTTGIYFAAMSHDHQAVEMHKMLIMRTLFGDEPIKIKPSASEMKFKLREVLSILTMSFISSEFNMVSNERESAVNRHKKLGHHQEIKDTAFAKSDLMTRIMASTDSNAKLIQPGKSRMEVRITRNNYLAYGFIADEYFAAQCEYVMAHGDEHGYTYEEKLQYGRLLSLAIKSKKEGVGKYDEFRTFSNIESREGRIKRLMEVDFNHALDTTPDIKLPDGDRPSYHGYSALNSATYVTYLGEGDYVSGVDPIHTDTTEKLQKLEQMYFDTCKNRTDIIYTEEFGHMEGFVNTIMLQESINFFVENGFLDRLSIYMIQIGGEYQHNIFEIVNFDDTRSQLAIIFKSVKFMELAKDNMH